MIIFKITHDTNVLLAKIKHGDVANGIEMSQYNYVWEFTPSF